MINQNMKPTQIYRIDTVYNDLGIAIETETFIKDIKCFVMLRSTHDKMFDAFSYEVADFIGITKDKTIVKGNILKQDGKAFKVVEVFGLLANSQLLLKGVA